MKRKPRMRAAIGVAAAGVALALALAAQTQRPPSAPGKQQTPVIRVTTRLVQVNVVVQDKHGEPVTDLKKEDFVLYDEGAEQAIRWFSVEALRNLTPAATPAPLPPNTYTNRLEQRGRAPSSITAILLDGLNTPIKDQSYARQEILKFLSQVQPQDRVALYALGRELRILHDFTSDTASLVRLLDHYRGNLAPENEPPVVGDSNSGIAQFDAWLRETDQEITQLFTTIRVGRTLRALTAIAGHLARLPGRKNLIWVSASFPFVVNEDSITTMRSYTEEIRRAARAVNGADVAIYPVDARGMVAPFSAAQWTNVTPSTGPASRPTGATRVTRSSGNLSVGMPAAFNASLDSMKEIAERTGGRAFYNTNDIQGAIRRAIEDSRLSYQLGYYPTNANWDGRYRQIKVKVKRDGVHIRHRLGYYAMADAGLDARERNAEFATLAVSPLDATKIGTTVTVHPGGADRTVALEVTIDVKDVALDPIGKEWIGGLEFLFVQRNEQGAALSNIGQRVNLRFPQADYEAAMRSGTSFVKRLTLVPQASEVRVIVRDTQTGALGSVQVPVGKSAATPQT